MINHAYLRTTHDVSVEVVPRFVPERSCEKNDYFFFSYSVKIKNYRKETIQLLKRHWIIRDGKGHEERVSGEGVVGIRPVLAPGEVFNYTSFCPLNTSTGNMRGKYEIVDAMSNNFVIKIPLFFLRRPETFH